ncbi:MAG: hypothetical protein ACREFW_02300 [Rhizomicrobium sp.]
MRYHYATAASLAREAELIAQASAHDQPQYQPIEDQPIEMVKLSSERRALALRANLKRRKKGIESQERETGGDAVGESEPSGNPAKGPETPPEMPPEITVENAKRSP